MNQKQKDNDAAKKQLFFYGAMDGYYCVCGMKGKVRRMHIMKGKGYNDNVV
ncbi:hypothetical protein [Anaerosolibacter carboniphilus]|uniref:hypothetical protein n=1 Tax=Anaerosolibacter carboniphilus TaxID=1417629 RepID=UPI001A9A9879|nr:hypothetical protein [Anaerosolibacter carboniphilus]